MGSISRHVQVIIIGGSMAAILAAVLMFATAGDRPVDDGKGASAEVQTISTITTTEVVPTWTPGDPGDDMYYTEPEEPPRDQP